MAYRDPEKKKEADRLYRAKNVEKRRQYLRRYNAENADKLRQYREENRERINSRKRAKYANDQAYRSISLAKNRNRRAVNHIGSRYQFGFNLKRNYGLSVEEFAWMWHRAEGKCEICKKRLTLDRRGYAVDHDHVTGRIRGLLCNTHNRALGFLDDSTEAAQSLIDYLEKHKGTVKP